MKARLNTRFATARETGEILGVPAARVKALVELAKSDRVVHFKKSATYRNGVRTNWKAPATTYRQIDFAVSPSGKRKKAKKSQASSKRRVRGKSQKATR